MFFFVPSETLKTPENQTEGMRDDTHMTSIKIIQFSRPPPAFSIYVQNSCTLLTLDAQFQTNLSYPNDNQSFKREHNPRMTIIF